MVQVKKTTNFNIYYLNVSKVYEIKMMINNVVPSYYEKEKKWWKRKGGNLSLNLNNGLKTGLENSIGETTRFKEFLEVKNTKSTFLKDIINNCHNKQLANCDEGDLLKIGGVSLEFLDEEMQRIISLIRKDIFKGVKIDEFEVNNMISSILADYPYFLKGKINSEKTNENILIKIPMENKSEFESKYHVNDLLIGNISIIGIYKGKVDENHIKKTTIDYFAEKDKSKPIFDKVEPSSSTVALTSEKSKESEGNFHFIDVIAIVQDVKFLEVKVNSLYEKIINFIMRRNK